MDRKKLVIDLDGTICTQQSSETYHLAQPIREVIWKVNKLWQEGWDVLIYTARGMNTCLGNVPEIEHRYRLMTEKWLLDNRVCYTQLKFGKPPGDVYVDDKALRPDEFTCKDI